MADTTKIALDSGTYTIAKLPGGEALDICFRLSELDGNVAAAAEAGRTGYQVHAIAQAVFARQMREPEFKARVWDRLLAFCTKDSDGRPVNAPGWEAQLRGDAVVDQLALFWAAAEFNTARFAKAFGTSADLLRTLKPVAEALGKVPDSTDGNG
jgi:hypothetical protein